MAGAEKKKRKRKQQQQKVIIKKLKRERKQRKNKTNKKISRKQKQSSYVQMGGNGNDNTLTYIPECYKKCRQLYPRIPSGTGKEQR